MSSWVEVFEFRAHERLGKVAPVLEAFDLDVRALLRQQHVLRVRDCLLELACRTLFFC